MIQKFWVRGKKETQKGLPVVRFNSDSGRHAEKSRMVAYTRKDIRLSCSCGSRCTWWCNYPRRYYCLRPWFSTISFPSMNSIFLYIIADLRRFVKEMGVLFTIRLLIVITKVFWQQQKREHLFAGVRGSNPQAAIRKDVLDKNIAYFGANVNRKIQNGR